MVATVDEARADPCSHGRGLVRGAALGWLALAVLAPLAEGQSKAVDEITDLFARPSRYAGDIVTVQGLVADPRLADAPKSIAPAFAVASPRGGFRLGVVAEHAPEIGSYVTVTGELVVDPDTPKPYMVNPEVEVVTELPLWQRPLDRQSLAAAGSLAAALLAVLVLAGAWRVGRALCSPPSPERLARALARLGPIEPREPPPPPPAWMTSRGTGVDAGRLAAVVVEVRSGPDAGREFTVHKDVITIGRRADRDVALTDPTAARFDASLIRMNGRLVLRAESPSSTVAVNSRPVNEAAVTEADTIRVGESELAIRPVVTENQSNV